jgi:hypothetical protein
MSVYIFQTFDSATTVSALFVVRVLPRSAQFDDGPNADPVAGKVLTDLLASIRPYGALDRRT